MSLPLRKSSSLYEQSAFEAKFEKKGSNFAQIEMFISCTVYSSTVEMSFRFFVIARRERGSKSDVEK